MRMYALPLPTPRTSFMADVHGLRVGKVDTCYLRKMMNVGVCRCMFQYACFISRPAVVSMLRPYCLGSTRPY